MTSMGAQGSVGRGARASERRVGCPAWTWPPRSRNLRDFASGTPDAPCRARRETHGGGGRDDQEAPARVEGEQGEAPEGSLGGAEGRERHGRREAPAVLRQELEY